MLRSVRCFRHSLAWSRRKRSCDNRMQNDDSEVEASFSKLCQRSWIRGDPTPIQSYSVLRSSGAIRQFDPGASSKDKRRHNAHPIR